MSDTPLADRMRKRPTRSRVYFLIITLCVAVVVIAFTLDHFARRSPLDHLPAELTAERDVRYGRLPTQALDIVFHSDRRQRPGIVMLHEGGWIDGDKSSYHAEMVHWANHGYVTVSVNYRLADEARFPAQIEDAKCAVRWLRAHADEYHVDSEAIGVTGWSAGAHLAMLVALADATAGLEGDGPYREQSSRVQAAVCIAGVYDLLPDDRQRWRSHDNDPCVVALLGGRASRHQELARQASPVRYLSVDDPPLLVIHGEHDRRIDVQQGRDFASALQRLGRTDQVMLYPGDHGSHVFPTGTAERTVVEAFFRKHLVTDGRDSDAP